jgi:hypothetical protein
MPSLYDWKCHHHRTVLSGFCVIENEVDIFTRSASLHENQPRVGYPWLIDRTSLGASTILGRAFFQVFLELILRIKLFAADCAFIGILCFVFFRHQVSPSLAYDAHLSVW